MKTKSLLFVSTLLLLFSCTTNEIYSDFDSSFKNNRWEQSDKKTHEFIITNDNIYYSLKLRFSHVYGYQFDSVPFDIAITYPSGKTEHRTVDLKIKDASGKELGDCSGDICDMELAFLDLVKLKKGKHKVVIAHTFKGPYLPNVIGVGLDVRR